MTTAREQAREAANSIHVGHLYGPFAVEREADECADAASDVWEPLLRDCVEQMKDVILLQSSAKAYEWHEVLLRAIEALG